MNDVAVPILTKSIGMNATSIHNGRANLPPMPPFMDAMKEMALEPEFQLRCAISFIVACSLYIGWGTLINGWYSRKVSYSVIVNVTLILITCIAL